VTAPDVTRDDTAAVPPKVIMVNGRPVRFRLEQMIFWSAIAAVLGSGFVAGLYFGVFQVRWTIHGRQLFYLKPWFDSGLGLFHSGNWVLYRHGLRDLIEPAFAVMGIKTLLASPRHWNDRVAAWRLAVTPVALIALAVGLAAGGIWLLDFGLPHAWHWAFGTQRVTAPPWIAHSSWQVIVLGAIMGYFVLHPLWAPVGATIQGRIIDRSVDRHKLGARIPLWATKPVSPPVVRERWWWTSAHDATVSERDATSKVLITIIVVVFVLVTALGLLAAHWIGLGHTVPYLAP
jgi:hypothetical protein